MAEYLVGQIPDNYPEFVHGCCYTLASLCSTHSFPDSVIVTILQVILPVFNSIDGICDFYKPIIADSVCYLLWACTRQYSNVLSSFIDDILSSLLVTSLTSDDLNIRRACAAVIQEFVGRLGNENVDHGLELVNLLSFNSLSQYYTTYAMNSVHNRQNHRHSLKNRSDIEVPTGTSPSIGEYD